MTAKPAASFRHTALCAALSILVALVFASPSAAAAMSAQQIVDAMVTAHGGMERWAGAPTVSFEDEFKFGDAEEGGVSRVTVEQGPRRAYLDSPNGETFVWDGEKAWSQSLQGGYPPRFLVLLNYHFLNLPWLAKDPGVQFGEPGTARLWDDPTDYLTVKITYGEGVGDTPGDYYLLYIHPETHRLAATEYIVTYRAILPEGVTASSPNTLVYDDFATTSGLTVPTAYSIYEPDQTLYATCDIRDWSFEKPFDASRMVMPEGAVVDESTP